ncbi:MAG: GNAT family N-acetyltransferase, partial [Pseudomonadota bacterium]
MFQFLRDLYDNQTEDSRMGGTWTRSLVDSELKNGSLLGLREDKGYLRAAVLYRQLPGNLEITILGTAQTHRRKGLMRTLVQRLQGKAQNLGLGILLEVHQ